MGYVSAVWGWQRVTHCLRPPPLEGVHIKNGMTEAEKGAQPPELVRGQGARRKLWIAVSWKNKRIEGRSAWETRWSV